MRRLVYHVSVTQDGFIAGPGGEFDFFVMNDGLAETLNSCGPRVQDDKCHTESTTILTTGRRPAALRCARAGET